MTVRRLAVSDCLQSCGLTSKGLSLCLFELNYRILREVDVSPVSPSSTSQDARHRVQKWNVGLERRKERETFCKILHSAKDLGVGITICIKV